MIHLMKHDKGYKLVTYYTFFGVAKILLSYELPNFKHNSDQLLTFAYRIFSAKCAY